MTINKEGFDASKHALKNSCLFVSTKTPKAQYPKVLGG